MANSGRLYVIKRVFTSDRKRQKCEKNLKMLHCWLRRWTEAPPPRGGRQPRIWKRQENAFS